MSELAICQIALCTTDLPSTVRTLTDGLGFASAGGRQLWGERLGRIQSLPTGSSTTCSLWWLIGRRRFMQLELFQHTTPAIAPRSRPWADNEIGWNRWGVAVLDFDATVERLHVLGVLDEDAQVVGPRGGRRLRFIEPGTQEVCIDVEEEPSTVQLVNEDFPLSPRITSVGLNVSNLDHGRELFHRLGFTERADRGARALVAFDSDGIVLEISQPSSAAEPARSLASDQGFMNIAVGSRWREVTARGLTLAGELGYEPTTPMPEVAGGSYVDIMDGLSMEFVTAPRELDGQFGFRPKPLNQHSLVTPRFEGGRQASARR
ncbi:MAG: hypothetical protein JWM76_24 [Pseudonocardiales bacterium]|nr:hypothetical protein [Pseudonocardiales bacterium]